MNSLREFVCLWIFCSVWFRVSATIFISSFGCQVISKGVWMFSKLRFSVNSFSLINF